VYQWFEGQIDSIPLDTITFTKMSSTETKLGQDFCDCDESGVRTQSYKCPPHIKYTEHLLYVWSGSSMSMKWMRGLIITKKKHFS